jgi:ABC-type sugar transport system ATPase subunit
MALLQELNRSGITVVLVTHEQDIAAFASRLLAFRDGKLVSDIRNAPNDAAAALERLRAGRAAAPAPASAWAGPGASAVPSPGQPNALS